MNVKTFLTVTLAKSFSTYAAAGKHEHPGQCQCQAHTNTISDKSDGSDIQ